MYRWEEQSCLWESKKDDERLQIDYMVIEEVQEETKAGVERGLYTKEQRTIQAFCHIIKSCDNSDHLEETVKHPNLNVQRRVLPVQKSIGVQLP